MADDDLIGEIIHLVSAITFPYTVEQLGSMTPDMLQALDIDSGEHSAAFVVATFLGIIPSAVDVDGGVDLMFANLPPTAAADVGCDDAVTSACFEVKSMRGAFRRFFNQRNTKIGDSHSTTIKTIADVVDGAQRDIRRAADALRSKTTATQSRNIVILVHFFEHIALEALESIFLSPHMQQPGDDLADIASIWFLIYPSHAVRWERSRRRWVNLGSGGSLRNEPEEVDSFGDVLIACERQFCDLYREGRRSAWAVFGDNGPLASRQT